MKPHKCEKSKTCICNSNSLEPKDDCPVHGLPSTRRCSYCGRFFTTDELTDDLDIKKDK